MKPAKKPQENSAVLCIFPFIVGIETVINAAEPICYWYKFLISRIDVINMTVVIAPVVFLVPNPPWRTWDELIGFDRRVVVGGIHGIRHAILFPVLFPILRQSRAEKFIILNHEYVNAYQKRKRSAFFVIRRMGVMLGAYSSINAWRSRAVDRDAGQSWQRQMRKGRVLIMWGSAKSFSGAMRRPQYR